MIENDIKLLEHCVLDLQHRVQVLEKKLKQTQRQVIVLECKVDRKTEPMKTTDYCDICKRDMCEVCIADTTNPYCVPSHFEINYEPKNEPQTEREGE